MADSDGSRSSSAMISLPSTVIAPSLTLDLAREAAEVRVVLEQVRQGLVVGQVVDRDDLEVAAGLVLGPEDVLPDPPEAVVCRP